MKLLTPVVQVIWPTMNETVHHGCGVRDDDHLARLGSCTHTPHLARHCRRNLVSSLSRGMPKVVIYR
jgi:hypothetical protein